MRCSLLTISSYLDGELSPERSGELEAHLVACARCSNGLGYLREEKERIRTLMAVHAREGAAEELLATVGLVAAPARPHDLEEPEPQTPPQFLLDLPDAGSRAPDVPVDPGTLELPGTAMPKVPGGTNGTGTPAPPPLEANDAAVPNGTFAPPDVAPPLLTPIRDAPPMPEPPPRDAGLVRELQPAPGDAAPLDAMPPSPDDLADPALAPVRPPRPASWFERARDTIALRWALMRGGEIDAAGDDDIQIVSGAGAPPRHAPRSVERPARTAGPAGAPVVAAAPPRSADPPAAPAEAEVGGPEHELMQPDEAMQAQAETFPIPDDAIDPRTVWPQLRPRAGEEAREPERNPIAPPLAFRDYGVDRYRASSPPRYAPEPAPEPPETQPPVSSPVPRSTTPQPAPQPAHARSGRHVRALHGGGRTFKLPAVPFPRPHPRGRRPALAGPLGDRRLWIFGSAVAILALIGLLLGKQVTQPSNPSLATGAVPNPTAIALPSSPAHAPTAAATPVPTPAPTAVPTPTPAPTPAQPNPATLTGVQTLGSGATGVQVQDLRYGEHPNDFRIVFDLSGGATPTTQVGFGNPTTLYVEFSGVTGGSAPAQPPAGQTATAVKLVQPSPIAGKTIYEITLARPATLATSYLLSPTRLVIDLG